MMNRAIIFNCALQQPVRLSGAYRIAHFLREEGWNVEVIEYAAYWAFEDLKRLIKYRTVKDIKFFGFSLFNSVWPNRMEEFSEWLKQIYPDIPLVCGSSNLPTRFSKYVDYYIYGYGELAILELCKSFTGNTPIEGIKFESQYEPLKVIDAINTYPAFPMRSLMIKYEDRDFILPSESLGISFSRGCKFQCIYCNYPVLGVKGDYTRDAEDYYVHLMDTYDRFGVTSYNVADETFNDTSGKIKKFAEITNKLSFKPWFQGYIRADLLVSRPQDWDELIKLGFYGHFYGIETTNPKTAKSIKKGMNPDILLPKLLDAKKYFVENTNNTYRSSFAVVVGLPHETKESQLKTTDWLLNNWKDQNVIITPLDIPRSQGIDRSSVLTEDYEKYGYKIYDKQKISPSSFQTFQGLWWENEHLNVEEATQYSNYFQRNYDEFTIGAGALFSINFLENTEMEKTLKYKLKYMNNDEFWNRHWNAFDKIICDYVNKKLAI